VNEDDELKKYDGKWDLISMFTSLELILLIIATLVSFGVLYSIISLIH
tara:strand:+ start:202 stop:345 length:144 start_codon:yes stop_codon:yes gene_type:complete